MKKNVVLLLAVVAVALASCGGGFKQGPGGMLYNIHVDKSGPKLKEGDFMAINLIAKTEADSELTNSYTTGRPFTNLMPKPQFKGDIYAALEMLAEGDSATVKMNLDSALKQSKGPRPPGLKGKYIIFTVKVEKVISKGNLTDQVFQDRCKAYYDGVVSGIKKKEPVDIANYISKHSLKVTKTADSLNYVITTPGSGPTPVAGDTVLVNYAGRMLSDKLFETNMKDVAQKEKKVQPGNPYQPIKIVVGVHQVIPGWDEALMLMNKGAKATLVIPSKLAYGEQGMREIQPFTPLVFDVELVNIIKPNPNAPKPVVPTLAPPTVNTQVPVKK